MVTEARGSGVCILGAKVDVIVRGRIAQSATITTLCDVWWVDGLFFRDLDRGVEVTLRASAAGYHDQDIVVMPTPVPGALRATIIELTKIPAP
jgi:hypothetical protein